MKDSFRQGRQGGPHTRTERSMPPKCHTHLLLDCPVPPVHRASFPLQPLLFLWSHVYGPHTLLLGGGSGGLVALKVKSQQWVLELAVSCFQLAEHLPVSPLLHPGGTLTPIMLWEPLHHLPLSRLNGLGLLSEQVTGVGSLGFLPRLRKRTITPRFE